MSCPVPWDLREQLDEPLFRQEVRHFVALGFRDLDLCGTAGEGYAVDTRRFDRVLKVFREETTRDGVTGMVGVN